MRNPWPMAATTALLVALTGCGEPAAPDTAAAAPAETGVATGVTREAVEAPPAPMTVVAQPALQTQPGPRGSQVSLTRVAVTGDIMTVALTYDGGRCCVHTPVDQVSVIDDATSQRIGVLKDNAGNWMAAPMSSDDKALNINTGRSPAQV